MTRLITALIIGAVFGIGLAIAGMLNPSKVVGFLDVFGDWDPSLAFVMGGGVLVNAIGEDETLQLYEFRDFLEKYQHYKNLTDEKLKEMVTVFEPTGEKTVFKPIQAERSEAKSAKLRVNFFFDNWTRSFASRF